MPKDFDLNSQQWLSLIFADKNQEYGAYVHRNESSDRHLIAIAIISVIALGVIFLPNLVKSVMPAPKVIEQVTIAELTNIDLEQEIPEENQVQQIEAPPPPELKATVAFTPPVITKDEEIVDEDLMKTQQELTEIKADISVATIEGVEGGTVDISDLIEQNVVVEAVEEKVYNLQEVQVQPQFPGGEAAMLKWMGENIKYPPSAEERGITGRATLKFVIKPDGSVADVEVIKGLDPACDREAKDKVSKMPKWSPGKQNGNPVTVAYILPVFFKLDNR